MRSRGGGYGESLRRLCGSVLNNEPSGGLIELARLNKVLLHYLRVNGVNGAVRDSEEAKLRAVVKIVEEVRDALSGLNYAFFKLVKPVTYTPADVDVLVASSEVNEAALRLIRLGFRLMVVEPYTITLVKNGINVDLYTNPSVGNIVYLNGADLLGFKAMDHYHGLSIPTLTREAEVVVAAAHAVYKEWLITLNDYATVKTWISRGAVELCLRMKCSEALGLVLSIGESACSGLIEMPYRIKTPLVMALLANRALRFKPTASTIPMATRRLNDARLINLVTSKLSRLTY
ncbi:hypothetical protein [Caldivirga sp.]|uniref:hypothetical protein n=1 Tax=Caldivirga sp. TaxID=2080243 RepID=UPI003D0A40F8